MTSRRRKVLGFVAGFLLVGAYFASGIYFVQPGERGVVRWFGRIPESSRRVGPGVHYALPWPMCKVDRPKTTEVRRVYVGILPERRKAIARWDREAMRTSPASDMLTGDVNILKVTMIVQYEVSDAAAYLFGAEDPDRLVHDTVQAVLIEALSAMAVDRALTGARTELQRETMARSQRLLSMYGCGVRLLSTSLDEIDPPQEIKPAFNKVTDAKKDGERVVDQAVTEETSVLSRARGMAAAVLEEAEADRETRTAQARGEADRFVKLLAAYRQSPELFRKRLLIQTMERVMGRMRTYVIDRASGDGPARVKIIERGKE